MSLSLVGLGGDAPQSRRGRGASADATCSLQASGGSLGNMGTWSNCLHGSEDNEGFSRNELDSTKLMIKLFQDFFFYQQEGGFRHHSVQTRMIWYKLRKWQMVPATGFKPPTSYSETGPARNSAEGPFLWRLVRGLAWSLELDSLMKTATIRSGASCFLEDIVGIQISTCWRMRRWRTRRNSRRWYCWHLRWDSPTECCLPGRSVA